MQSTQLDCSNANCQNVDADKENEFKSEFEFFRHSRLHNQLSAYRLTHPDFLMASDGGASDHISFSQQWVIVRVLGRRGTTVVILMSRCHVIIEQSVRNAPVMNIYTSDSGTLCANVNWQLGTAETEWNYTWNEYLKRSHFLSFYR